MVTCRIVASLVRAQTVPFLLNILKWLLVAIPATWTNSWLSYVQNKLALAYRTRLTDEVMRQYLGDGEEDPKNGKVFYKLGVCRLRHDGIRISFGVMQPILMTESRTRTSMCLVSYKPRTTYSPFTIRMITHDIQRFSTHLAAIYANLAKPVLDVILYNYQLSQNVGAEGLILLTVLVQTSAAVCKHPPTITVCSVSNPIFCQCVH